jgi:hypothetical protein
MSHEPPKAQCEHLEMRDLATVSICSCGHQITPLPAPEGLAAARAHLRATDPSEDR